MLSLGRIVTLDVTLKAVCPGKRAAVSVILYEILAGGKEEQRGIKHILIPASSGESCRDIILKDISFSVPEMLNPSSSLCSERKFKVRVVANYVDSDLTSLEISDLTI